MTANSLYCSLYLDYIECPGKAGMKIIKTLLLLPSSCGGYEDVMNISLSYPVCFHDILRVAKNYQKCNIFYRTWHQHGGVINRYLRCVILMNVVQVELR